MRFGECNPRLFASEFRSLKASNKSCGQAVRRPQRRGMVNGKTLGFHSRLLISPQALMFVAFGDAVSKSIVFDEMQISAASYRKCRIIFNGSNSVCNFARIIRIYPNNLPFAPFAVEKREFNRKGR